MSQRPHSPRPLWRSSANQLHAPILRPCQFFPFLPVQTSVCFPTLSHVFLSLVILYSLFVSSISIQTSSPCCVPICFVSRSTVLRYCKGVAMRRDAMRRAANRNHCLGTVSTSPTAPTTQLSPSTTKFRHLRFRVEVTRFTVSM